MNSDYWKQRCEAAEDALRRARSKLMMTGARRRVLAVLAELQEGRSLPTAEVAQRLRVKEDTAKAALHKLAEAGLVDRSKHRGHNGAPVRWKLGHLVVPQEEIA